MQLEAVGLNSDVDVKDQSSEADETHKKSKAFTMQYIKSSNHEG